MLSRFGEYLLYTLIAATLLFTCSQAAPAQCKGTYQVALSKDSTLTVPCANMVLMNLGTFSGYYQARQNYEALKEQIPEYQAVTDSVQASLSANIENLESVIEMEQTSKEQAMKAVLKLERENARLRQRFHVTKWLAIGGIGYISFEGIKALMK